MGNGRAKVRRILHVWDLSIESIHADLHITFKNVFFIIWGQTNTLHLD